MADQDFIDRMQSEYGDLSARILKLSAFLSTEAFEKLPSLQRTLLEAQLSAMNSYATLLGARMVDLAKTKD